MPADDRVDDTTDDLDDTLPTDDAVPPATAHPQLASPQSRQSRRGGRSRRRRRRRRGPDVPLPEGFDDGDMPV